MELVSGRGVAYVNKNSTRNCCCTPHRNLLGICSCLPALLCSIAITTALFTAFCRGGDGGKSKIYAEITQRVVSPTHPSPDQLSSAAKIPIGNGLETVCGAGEMRRDKLPVRRKIVYGLGVRLKRIPELPHTHRHTRVH